MADKSRRSSTELDPDLLQPSAPKGSKTETSSPGKSPAEEHLTETELDPDLSQPSAPERSKTETSSPVKSPAKEHLTETELDPDLSQPPVPERSKTETSSPVKSPAEEHLTETGGTETPSTSESILKKAEIVEEEEALLTTEVFPQKTPLTEIFSSSTEVRTDSEPSAQEAADVATTSREAVPSTSKEAPLATLVMKYEQHEGSDASGSMPETSAQFEISVRGENASYKNLSLIGNGAYGTVYQATDETNGQIVALKKVKVPLTEDGLPMSTLREISTLKQLERFEHPNIIRLLDVCQDNCPDLPSNDGEQRSERVDRGVTLWLVFEHMERDLASYISNSPRLGIPAHIVRQMAKEIICGVGFLHSHRIIHRDLKPANLLLSREGRIKIADFGLAKTYDFEMRLTTVVVTQWYRPPEVLLGCSYATPVDIWSIGCIIAELCRLVPLFPGTSEGDQLDKIFQVLGTPSEQEWPENVSISRSAFPFRQPRPLGAIIPDLNEHGLDLLKRMLMFDPHSRITAAQAARHRYFSEDDVL